ncbi:MAG TPA: hypothetical protein VF360_03200, partial [Candidatus Methanoperedens sp.]
VSLDDARVNDSNATSKNETKTVETSTSGSWFDEKVNETETALKKSVTDGITGFFISAADGIFNIGGTTNESEAVKNDYGYAVGSVFKIATYKNDPYASPTVQAMRQQTAIIGIFIFILYVFYGAACVNLTCGSMGIFERVQYTVSNTVSSLEEYKNTLIMAFGAIFFIHYIFKFIILFNYAITTEAMYSVLDSIPLTVDNWVMYVCMAVCYGLESVFFALRILLMDLIAGCDILLGALFAFSFTRQLSIETVKYFGKITLMQFIIVLLTAFGVRIIQESPYGRPLGYLCLILVLIIISGGIMFGFSKIFTASKTLIRGYRYR